MKRGQGRGARVRIERDTLGSLPVPTRAYYGIQTRRALMNFPISLSRYRGSGAPSRGAALCRRDISVPPAHAQAAPGFCRFVPYLERLCRRFWTPTASSAPRTKWYLTPGRSFTRPPLTKTMECSWRLWPTPGI